MPSPIQPVGTSRSNNPEIPTLPKPGQEQGSMKLNPFSIKTVDGPTYEKPPTNLPSLGEGLLEKNKGEIDRIDEISTILSEPRTPIVNIVTGDEEISFAQSVLHIVSETQKKQVELSKETGGTEAYEWTLHKDPHKPLGMHASDFKNYKYGIRPKNIEDFARMTIGAIPSQLVKMAYYAMSSNYDLFSPSIGYREGMSKQDFQNSVISYLNDEDERKEKIFGFLHDVRPTVINAIAKAEADPDSEEAQKLVLCPVEWTNALEILFDFLDNKRILLTEYAKNLATYAINQRDVGLTFDPNVITKILAQSRGGSAIEKGEEMKQYNKPDSPQILLSHDYSLGQEGKSTYERAKGLFFLGQSKDNTIFIDITKIPESQVYADTDKGIISPEFKDILKKMYDYAQETSAGQLTKRKVVILTKKPLLTMNPNTHKTEPLDFIKNFDLPTPKYSEMQKVLIPKWLSENFNPNPAKRKRRNEKGEEIEVKPYSFIDEKGKPIDIFVQDEETGEWGHPADNPNVLDSISVQIARYTTGLSAISFTTLVAEAINKTKISMQKTHPHLSRYQIQAQFGNKLKLTTFLKFLRENYIKYRFGANEQLKEMFQVYDPKQDLPPNMKNPDELAKKIEAYRQAEDTGSSITDNAAIWAEDKSSAQKKQEIKEVLDSMGLNIETALGYPEKRNEHMPTQQKTWADLDLSDPETVTKVREQVEYVIKNKKRNFILLHGPAGMGKTTSAMAIADLLNFGFMEWHMCKSLNKYVGETEARLASAFDFVMGLRDYVILLDEVDGCLGRTAADGGGGGEAVERIKTAFKTFFNKLEKAASVNNIVLVSTTNYLNRIEESYQRRLGASLSYELTYASNEADIRGVVNSVIQSNSKHPMFATFVHKIQDIYVKALCAEVTKKKPYSNKEMHTLFKEWINWNTEVVRSNSELGSAYMWNPATLTYAVQNSIRQTSGQSTVDPNTGKPIEKVLEVKFPSIGEVKSGMGKIDKTQVKPIVNSPEGFSEVKTPSTQRTITPTKPPVPVQVQKKPPLANEVDVEIEDSQAEENLLGETKKASSFAPIRAAALQEWIRQNCNKKQD